MAVPYHDSAEIEEDRLREAIFKDIEVLRWSPLADHDARFNEHMKQFFINIFHLYFKCPEESRITAENLTEQEKAILKTYWESFCSYLCHRFASVETTSRSRSILSGIVYFRLELIPMLLTIFQESQLMVHKTMHLLAAMKAKEEIWIEQLIRTQDDPITKVTTNGPPGHFWWRKDITIPESYLSDLDDEYRLAD